MSRSIPSFRPHRGVAAMACLAALSACGGGGGGVAPEERASQALLRAALELPGQDPASLPTTGSVAFDGEAAFVERAAGGAIVGAYSGDLTMTVDFGRSIDGISGEITDIVEESDGPQGGTLVLGSGTLPGVTRHSVLSRSGSIVVDPERTFGTFAVASENTLTDSTGASYAVDVDLVGDVLGTGEAAVGGVILGDITRDGVTTTTNGAFYAERD